MGNEQETQGYFLSLISVSIIYVINADKLPNSDDTEQLAIGNKFIQEDHTTL